MPARRSVTRRGQAPAGAPTVPSGDRFWREGLAIFAVALIVRLIHVWQIRQAPFFSVLMGDSRAYDEWARRIAGGDWVGHEVFYQAPLYPYFLGLLYTLVGRDLLLIRIAQATLGASACVLLGLAGRRFFSRPVGLISGLLLALYAPAIFFDSLLQKSVLDVFFICLTLWIVSGLVLGEARRPRPWIPIRRQTRMLSPLRRLEGSRIALLGARSAPRKDSQPANGATFHGIPRSGGLGWLV